jgi:hypothetical protein
VECDGLINEVSTFFDDITYLLLPKSNTLEWASENGHLNLHTFELPPYFITTNKEYLIYRPGSRLLRTTFRGFDDAEYHNELVLRLLKITRQVPCIITFSSTWHAINNNK